MIGKKESGQAVYLRTREEKSSEIGKRKPGNAEPFKTGNAEKRKNGKPQKKRALVKP